MKITVYSTTSSESSRELKKYLEGRGLVFEEKVIDVDDKARDEMEKEADGFMGVPLVVFSDGQKTERVIGFNKKKLEEILGK